MVILMQLEIRNCRYKITAEGYDFKKKELTPVIILEAIVINICTRVHVIKFFVLNEIRVKIIFKNKLFKFNYNATIIFLQMGKLPVQEDAQKS